MKSYDIILGDLVKKITVSHYKLKMILSSNSVKTFFNTFNYIVTKEQIKILHVNKQTLTYI